MSTQHGFDADIAAEYGLEEAIFLNHFFYWYNYYKANHKKAMESGNFNDDSYWVYNSVEGWRQQYKYLTPAVIKRALDKLEKLGFIKVGNYNKTPYDKTKWYSLTPLAISVFRLAKIANGVAELTNGVAELTDSIDQNNQPIPILTNTKKNKNNKKENTVKDELVFNFEEFSENEVRSIHEWFAYKKELKSFYKTQAGLNKFRTTLLNFKRDQQSIVALIDYAISHEWQGVYPAKGVASTQFAAKEEANIPIFTVAAELDPFL